MARQGVQSALAQVFDQAREHAADQRRLALAGFAPVDDEVAQVPVQRLDPLRRLDAALADLDESTAARERRGSSRR